MTQTESAYAAEDQAIALVATWHELEAERTHIVEGQERIKARLVEIFGLGRHEAGASVVTVMAPPRRFDPEQASHVLPPETLAMCTRVVVDSVIARRVLPPDLYSACQASKPGAAPIVRIS